MGVVRTCSVGIKILVVDDNAAVRKLIRQVVSEIADEVYECFDGDQSLLAYRDLCPDLVLMDVRMPSMDGLTATRHLKATYPAAKVVIVTDYDDDEVRLAAKEAGACGYALKQNLMVLGDVIKSLCDPAN